MTELLTPDICVIGAGPGGLSVAAAAAAVGVSAVLIEKAGMGGEGLRQSGPLPAQALLAAAAHAHALRNSTQFGFKAARITADLAAINAYAQDVIAAVAPNFARERFVGLGVRVVNGTARFVDADTVAVGDFAVKARRFVIATGSSPLIPPIPGLLHTPHLTDESVFRLAECPRHLVVIGAGARCLELAQAFRRLGAEVTVLTTAAPLPGEDRECAAVVLDAIEREGVKLRCGVEITKVSRALAKIHIVLETPGGVETVEGSRLLVVAGRRPNIEDLDLDAAGIRYRPEGIVVDGRLMTTNKRVYAVGDVTGGPHFTHLAHYHANVVICRELFRLRSGVNGRPVPRVTYTDPELAHVGLSEEEAQAKKRTIRVLRWPYRENDRAQAQRATNGHIKVITDGKGDILGATIVGVHAAENITAWTLAVSQRLNIRAFAGLIVPYPTFAEVGKRAAITYFSLGLTPSRARRIIDRLMRWRRRGG